MLTAPISRAGVVLSQPPISTVPSTGYDRSSSSVSIASRFRYSIAVGFWNVSPPIEPAGSSTGYPPACHTPRFTASARSRRWVWQGLISLQVLMMPITGLFRCSSAPNPICRVRERWLNARSPSPPYQR